MGDGRRATDHHGVQGRTDLLHVMPLATRERDRQRDVVRVREYVPFGAGFPTIRRVFTGFISPFPGAETIATSRELELSVDPFQAIVIPQASALVNCAESCHHRRSHTGTMACVLKQRLAWTVKAEMVNSRTG